MWTEEIEPRRDEVEGVLDPDRVSPNDIDMTWLPFISKRRKLLPETRRWSAPPKFVILGMVDCNKEVIEG
jgi:hypothetical protein